MPRPYHSPSSIDLGRRCERAWAYRYIAKMREPDVDYRDIELKKIKAVFEPRGSDQCSYKQRGAALGAGVHATFEAHYLFGSPDWSWFPGQVAQSGLHYLPAREECAPIEIEREIGNVPVAQTDPRKPSKGLRAENGIILVGKRDLTVFHGVKWLLADYKSTASIVKYAKTAEILGDDLAACAYAFDCYENHPDDYYGDCLWLYLETKAKRQALPVDFRVKRDHALDVLREAATFAAHLDTIVAVSDAKQETRSCCDFSGRPGEIGCSYHVSKGGPCTARPGLGQLIQARAKERIKINMPTAEELKAKLAASRAARTATIADTADEAKKEGTGQVEAAVNTPIVSAVPKKGGPKKGAIVPAGASDIVAKANEIAILQVAADAAVAAVAAAKQELAALCI